MTSSDTKVTICFEKNVEFDVAYENLQVWGVTVLFLRSSGVLVG